MSRDLADLVAATSDEARRRQLVRVAMRLSEAICGAYFERVGDEVLRSVVIEGLFPPQSVGREGETAVASSRARLVEWAMRGESLTLKESWLGALVRTGEGTLSVGPSKDGRIPRHADAALEVRSIIAAPVKRGAEVCGVVAVANPVHGGAFANADLSAVTAWLGRAQTVMPAQAALK